MAKKGKNEEEVVEEAVDPMAPYESKDPIIPQIQQIKPQNIIDHLFVYQRESQQLRTKHVKAALSLQKVYRQYRSRKAYWKKLKAILTIQRVYRGHLHGRRVVQELKQKQKEQDEMLMYHYFATQIQKVYRGYAYRKANGGGFYARLAELNEIEARGEALLEEIEQKQEQKREEKELAQMERERKEFEETAISMHHMVSTASMPGAYKPAYHYESHHTIYNEPVEDTIKKLTRKKLRSQVRKQQKKRFDANRTRHLKRTYKLQSGVPLGQVDDSSSDEEDEIELEIKMKNDPNHVPGAPLPRKIRPVIDPRESMRNAPHRRLGPFRPTKQLKKIRNQPPQPTILTAAPYDTVDIAHKKERAKSKLYQVSDKPFALRKPNPLPRVKSIHIS